MVTSQIKPEFKCGGTPDVINPCTTEARTWHPDSDKHQACSYSLASEWGVGTILHTGHISILTDLNARHASR